jgi:hypothetical protein
MEMPRSGRGGLITKDVTLVGDAAQWQRGFNPYFI